MNDIEKELKASMSLMNNFRHITYSEKIVNAYEEILDTDPSKIMKWGREEWDNLLGGIYGGKVYVVGADTGVGKTTFVNQVCRNVAKQGFRVVKYSLEDRMEDIGKEEIFYEMNRLYYSDFGRPNWQWIKFVNN